jgi:hypothetical protein
MTMPEHRGYGVLRLLAGAVMISFAPVFVRVIDVPPTTGARRHPGALKGLASGLVRLQRQPERL